MPKQKYFDTNCNLMSHQTRTRMVVGPMSREEVLAQSNAETLCLIIIENRVYDCTCWQHIHPGGRLNLRALCGRDATLFFFMSHPKYIGESMLRKLFYAELRGDKDCDDSKDRSRGDGTTLALSALTRAMEDEGLFKTDISFYYNKMVAYSCMFLAILAGVLLSQRSWVHALSGVLMGVFWQQMAFIGHDLGHNLITGNREIDSYLGLIVGNLMTGVSMAWWKRSHNLHHVVTNSCDYDPDIQHLPVFAVDSIFFKRPIFYSFTNRALPLNRAAHILVKYQHFLYYPVMAIARINLYVQSFKHSLRLGDYATTKDRVWCRELQIATLMGFWIWLITLTMQLPNRQSRLLFLIPAHVVAGILHVQITLSHFAMPVHAGFAYEDDTNEYLGIQLRASMDIDCPKWMDWFHGGLQFQVVHHVWPRLPRYHLRGARNLLRAFCLQHGLEYHHATFFQANKIVIARLREISKSTKCFSELFADSMNLAG